MVSESVSALSAIMRQLFLNVSLCVSWSFYMNITHNLQTSCSPKASPCKSEVLLADKAFECKIFCVWRFSFYTGLNGRDCMRLGLANRPVFTGTISVWGCCPGIPASLAFCPGLVKEYIILSRSNTNYFSYIGHRRYTQVSLFVGSKYGRLKWGNYFTLWL